MATNLEQVVDENVECSICLNYLNEPKQLACSHTFCQGCLALLYKSQLITNQVRCPVCRKITDVRDGDVSNLQTNIPLKSMVEAVRNARRAGKQHCSAYHSGDFRPYAVTYCQDCDAYMCMPCQQRHEDCAEKSGHVVVTMADIRRGKSSTKNAHKCQIHGEDKDFYCGDCGQYVCFHCAILVLSEEEKPRFVSAEERETNRRKYVEYLQKKAEVKTTMIRRNLDIIEEERGKLRSTVAQITKEIDEAYEDSVKQLQQKRDKLLIEFEEHVHKQLGDLAV